MDEQPASRPPTLSAEAEARRRAGVLAELRRRRTRRRWTVGLSTLAASALIIAGSAVAWSSQARAGALAGAIESWHVEHERAGCELAVRIVRAVGLERRAKDVLEAADLGAAEELLPSAERTRFAEQREALLTGIADGVYMTDEDRELADRWEARALATGDPGSFDLLGECIAAAAADRQPLAGVTAERVDALARELRRLGDPRDFDDARIDRLEAALAQLGASAVRTAEGRADVAAVQARLGLAPAEALGALKDADDHLAALLAARDEQPSLADILDLVEGMGLHAAAAWVAEAFQLAAQGEQEAADALLAASQQTRDAIARAAPRPITDYAPVRPAPVREVPAPAPAPSSPSPGPSRTPVPPPAPSGGVGPALPPVIVPPLDPSPAPEPQPTAPAEPSEPLPPVDPSPSIDPSPDAGLSLPGDGGPTSAP
ncbi:hypothetical protein [Agrococcus carbonis]|uniref:hypothetical protein n=1 Tax=Agrococcus carbonis TaxID=684552 RepID=UPI000B871391|nr:hypothetical protein [Agrococcus carbonis]